MTLGLAVATAIPLLTLWAIYRLDLYATRAFRFVVLCLAWGIIATRVALLGNTALLSVRFLDASAIAPFGAPLIEEAAKALIILYLIYRPRFTYFVDGAIYGFAVGIGFAVVENYSYLLRDPNSAAVLAGGRVLSTNLMHASTTAIAGIALGLARLQPSAGRRVLFGLAGLSAAVLTHMGFNVMVNRFGGSAAALYVLAAGYGLASALGIGLVIRLGLDRASTWIGASLAASTRVAAGETHAVGQLRNIDAVLRPIAVRFGPAKADEVRALLLLQARLGILDQTGTRLPDGEQKRRSAEERRLLHVEMDARRRSIGVYCMLFLRAIALDRPQSIWEGLEAASDRLDSRAGRARETAGADGPRQAVVRPSSAAEDARVKQTTDTNMWARMDTRLPVGRSEGRRTRMSSPRRWLTAAIDRVGKLFDRDASR